MGTHVRDAWPFPSFQAPLRTPGLVAWYRSDLGITVTGAGVSAWADQSGNGNHAVQGTDALRPPYVASGGGNNRPYLNFGGAHAVAAPDAASLDMASEVAMLAVCKSGAVALATLVSKGREAVNFNYALMHQYSAAGSIDALYNSGHKTPGPGTWPNFAAASPSIAVVNQRNDTGNTEFYVDGTKLTTTSAALVVGAQSLHIGATLDGAGSYQWFFTGQLYEIAVWNRCLTDREAAFLLDYKRAMYGA